MSEWRCLAGHPNSRWWRLHLVSSLRSLRAAVYNTWVRPSFEIFDHTADAGIRVRAATLPGLIEPAARGLYAVIGEFVESTDEEAHRFAREGMDPAELLRDFLAELLLIFESRHRAASVLDVAAFDKHALDVSYRTRHVDADRSIYFREVKAVTYHDLAIRPIPGGFEATLIVDI